ncbi:probable lysosomal cobalamin transporter [Octopus bimaculoides]|uniref:probable lysosomal cobalamin transporter n=1 Tax=Octopus bimaculoides TaxID=37653 RepID=UPI0022E7C37B|nr:probable lysosomal cobalamin transporter [Octopus bimaculoides]
MVSVSVALIEGWLPFVAILVLIVLFSTFYVRHFISKYDSECSSTMAAIIGLSAALVTSAIVPVDIFLVSYMKDSDGHFRDWANSSSARDHVTNSVLISYYVMYGLLTFLFFLFLPFMYFFFEEKDDIEQPTVMTRCCGAFKYTFVFVLIAAVLLILGVSAVVPQRSFWNSSCEVHESGSARETDRISTRLTKNKSWGRFVRLKAVLQHGRSQMTETNKKIHTYIHLSSLSASFFFLFYSFISGGEDALSFLISSLSLLGMLAIITYTAYGMSAMPVRLIKGYRNISKDRLAAEQIRSVTTKNIDDIKSKYTGRRSMSSRDQARISELEENRRFLERQDRHLAEEQNSCLRKCLLVFRPFEIFVGVFCLLLTLLIFLSLLLTNIDKAMNSLGYKIGYALPKSTLPNPIDMILVFSQKVYPLDYIIILLIIIYLVFCSISGIRNLGIWFFCVRLYKIRPYRTTPQGMLMMNMILMLIVLAINVILFELTPQYSSFGSEVYVNTTYVPVGNSSSTPPVMSCNVAAPEDLCIMTRLAVLLTKFFYSMWFFGAAYYWFSWVFLAVIPIGFIIVVVRRRRSAIEGLVDHDDFEDSDDDLIHA